MILTVKELAVQMSLHPNYLKQLVREHKIPAGKIGRTWYFIQEDVENAIRGGYDESVRGDSLQPLGEEICEFTNEMENSATTSTSKGTEYENLLKLPPKKK